MKSEIYSVRKPIWVVKVSDIYMFKVRKKPLPNQNLSVQSQQ